ncbi:MAG: 16S rRNA (cytidine(1402)-2'-O)-methyltransferase [Bdellovibrionales bacterium]|nr:16S rRNA (cytidine(1402)-2'-O)-methyltransferase [Bdellovibrionales bacterium]
MSTSKLIPGLWVVATPIGNLSDLSERARAALSQADAILCEDTRRGQALLSSLGLSKRCERLDEHSSQKTLEKYVEVLASGRSLALITDAGTPGISDPGGRMVAAARQAQVSVQAIAGPSAITAALSISGLEISRFSFLGFLPRKESAILEALQGGIRFTDDSVQEADSVGRSAMALWFESPERIEETLGIFQQTLDTSMGLFLAKEVTKVFERVWVGPVRSVVKEFHGQDDAVKGKGEWIIGIYKTLNREKISKSNISETHVPTLTSMQAAEIAAQILLDLGTGTTEAAKQISQRFGVNRAEIYSWIVKRKNEN